MKLEDFATVEEAAEEIGVKYKTLLARISRGDVPAKRLGGKLFLIAREDIPQLKQEEETRRGRVS